MGFELKKPFKEYVAVDVLPKTGDATNTVITFPYQIEGTKRTEREQFGLAYTDTQAAIDAKNGINGLARQHEEAIATMERAIAQKLKLSGDRIYDSPDQRMAIWGKKK